jgi:hypothetical protein
MSVSEMGNVFRNGECFQKTGMFSENGNVFRKWECFQKTGMFSENGNVFRKQEFFLNFLNFLVLRFNPFFKSKYSKSR